MILEKWVKKIPYGKQELTQEDIDSVVSVLKSDFWTQGPVIPSFEKAFAKYVGANYAVAVSNGTAALHLCNLALNLKAGDRVITTPLTFVATPNSARYCGADVIFADVDPETYLLDIKNVRQILESDESNSIKGILPVNFAGRVQDMESLRALANEFNCWIIEDACHSPGGSFKDSNGNYIKAGSGQYADLSIFSFHPVKHIAAGEGGMITTNNNDLYLKLLQLRTHGIQQDPTRRIYDNSLWYYEMQELGYNYRLTDIQAALGNSQLGRAEFGLEKRRRIAKTYKESFKNHPNIIDRNEGYSKAHAYHLYVIEVNNRKELHSILRDMNVYTQIHYLPAHLMPYYRNFGWKEGDLPYAEKYYERCISLPIYPSLSEAELNYVISLILKYA